MLADPYQRVAEVAAEQGIDAEGVARVVRSARAVDRLEPTDAAVAAAMAEAVAAMGENQAAYDALTKAEEDALDEAFAVLRFEDTGSAA